MRAAAPRFRFASPTSGGASPPTSIVSLRARSRVTCPIEQPTTFKLVLNLSAAKNLWLAVSPALRLITSWNRRSPLARARARYARGSTWSRPPSLALAEHAPLKSANRDRPREGGVAQS
jgi:hypothetical protein